MDKFESSLENLIGSISENNIIKTNEWSIRDFNNVETADRKLILNKKLCFWVHDDALIIHSEYFHDLFTKNIKDFNLQEINLKNKLNENNFDYRNSIESDEEIQETEIELPFENLFFDILLWMYTNESKKLKKAAKTFSLLMNLICLGIKLKMKEDFFDILLNKIEFEWKVEYFNDVLWSKANFTFPILERIIEDMKADKLIKIIALLSWLKIDDCEINNCLIYPIDDNNNNDDFYKKNSCKENFQVNKYQEPYMSEKFTNNSGEILSYNKKENDNLNYFLEKNTNNKNKIEINNDISPENMNIPNDDNIAKKKANQKRILESEELFYVRNFLIKSKLMSNMKSQELLEIKNKFRNLHYAFDSKTLIEDNLFCSNKTLTCLACKKSFFSPFDVQENLECKGKYYHPRFIVSNKSEKIACPHEKCKKKILKGEYPCCHKSANTQGCTLTDGKHYFVLAETT